MNEYERVEKILCHPFGSNNSFQLLSFSHSILFITVTLFSILWFQLFRTFKDTFISINCYRILQSFGFWIVSIFLFPSLFSFFPLSISLTSSKKMIQIYVQSTVCLNRSEMNFMLFLLIPSSHHSGKHVQGFLNDDSRANEAENCEKRGKRETEEGKKEKKFFLDCFLIMNFRLNSSSNPSSYPLFFFSLLSLSLPPHFSFLLSIAILFSPFIHQVMT